MLALVTSALLRAVIRIRGMEGSAVMRGCGTSRSRDPSAAAVGPVYLPGPFADNLSRPPYVS
jgi:hypothetical protein